ncbi:MAG: hypothetical protein J3K34DRAFT_527439 [Monoraphidium minutum]|nr:MAG: hypothetical protein J3K34DRAFT_527439 [Monoraphidium minutum]
MRASWPSNTPHMELDMYLDDDTVARPGGGSSGAARADARRVEAALDDALRALESALQADPNLVLEAKSWLVDVVASLEGVAPDTALACFLPSRAPRAGGGGGGGAAPPLNAAAERQLLRLACEARAPQVAALLSGSAPLLRGLFSRSDALAAAWFGGLGAAPLAALPRGAGALANFALAARGDAWRHLVWAGRHPQAPVAVAAKPHYWAELDVPATLRNLARGCPEFWESRELRRSLESGEWLALDLDYCSKELQERLHSGGGAWRDAITRELEDLLARCDWRVVCQQVLPLMGEAELLSALRALGDAHFSRRAGRDLAAWAAGGGGGGGGAALVLAGVRWRGVRDVLLANALAARGGVLARLLAREEGARAGLARAERASGELHGGGGGGEGTGGDGGGGGATARVCTAAEQRRLLLILDAWALRLQLLRRLEAAAAAGGGGGARALLEAWLQSAGWRWELCGGGGGGRRDYSAEGRGAARCGGGGERRGSPESPGQGSGEVPAPAAAAGPPGEREPLARGAAPRSGGKRARSRSRSRGRSGGSSSRSRSSSRGRSKSRRRKEKRKKKKKRRSRQLGGGSPGWSAGSGDPAVGLASGSDGGGGGGGSGSDGDPLDAAAAASKARRRGSRGGGGAAAGLGALPAAYRLWPPGGGSALDCASAEAVVECLVEWACRQWVRRALARR